MIGKTNVGGGGVRGIDFGEVTLASKATSVTVSHNLGVVPSYIALVPKVFATASAVTIANLDGITIENRTGLLSGTVANTLTEIEITFVSSERPFKATDYYWIAIA